MLWMRFETNKWDMLPWWSLLGLLSWCPVSKSSQYNWFEDRVPDFQISCSDLIRMGGHQYSSSRNGHQGTFSIECILIFRKWWHRYIPSTRSFSYNLKWIFTLVLSIQWQSVPYCSSPIITLGRLPTLQERWARFLLHPVTPLVA